MKKILSLLLALVMILALAAGCGSQTTDPEPETEPATSVEEAGEAPEEPAEEDAYRILKVGVPTTTAVGSVLLTPPTTFTYASDAVGYLSYNHLFSVNLETDTVEPELVDEYYWEDETTLVMTLKEAYWSDGTPVTGHDVIATMAYPVDIGAAQKNVFNQFDPANSTVSEDGLTLTVKFMYPFGPGINYMTFGIMQKAFLEEHYYDGSESEGIEIWMDGNVVPHSGPYTRTEYVADTYEVYKLREDYWNAENEHYDYDEIQIYQYNDRTAMFIDFETGNLDIVLDITEADYLSVQDGAVDGAVASITKVCDTQNLMFNSKVEAFQDERVREAIAIGCDTEAMALVGYGVFGKQATSILPESCLYYSNVGAYEYNPERARELLAETGLTPEELTFKAVVVNNSQQVALMEAFQAYMADIGVTINMEVYEQSTAAPMYFAGESDFQLQQRNGGTPYKEPHHLLGSYLNDGSSIFPILVCDAEYNSFISDLLIEGSKEVDPEKRAEIYRQAQEGFHNSFTSITVCEYGYGNAYNGETVASAYLPTSTKLDLRFVYAE